MLFALAFLPETTDDSKGKCPSSNIRSLLWFPEEFDVSSLIDLLKDGVYTPTCMEDDIRHIEIQTFEDVLLKVIKGHIEHELNVK